MPRASKITISLTKREIEALEPRPGQNYIVFDQDLPGFGIRVMPSGRRYFLVQYRFKGRTRRLMLGMYGAVTPDEARKQAKITLGQAEGDTDPADQRDQARRAGTVAELGKRFLDQYVPARCKPSTAAEYKRSVELFIKPKLGSRRVADIARADVSEFHYELRHIPYQANRTLGVLSKMFNLAEEWGLRPDGSNPCRHRQESTRSSKRRALSLRRRDRRSRQGARRRRGERPGRESGHRVHPPAAADRLPPQGDSDPPMAACRSPANDCLRLPDSKTGAKIVQIGQAAIDVLNTIAKIDDNPYVIVGTNPGAHWTDMHGGHWRRASANGPVSPRFGIHDLRHTLSPRPGSRWAKDCRCWASCWATITSRPTARYAHLATVPVKARRPSACPTSSARCSSKKPPSHREIRAKCRKQPGNHTDAGTSRLGVRPESKATVIPFLSHATQCVGPTESRRSPLMWRRDDRRVGLALPRPRNPHQSWRDRIRCDLTKLTVSGALRAPVFC